MALLLCATGDILVLPLHSEESDKVYYVLIMPASLIAPLRSAVHQRCRQAEVCSFMACGQKQARCRKSGFEWLNSADRVLQAVPACVCTENSAGLVLFGAPPYGT